MLPANCLAIINNIAALGLPPRQCAAVIAAVLEPLLQLELERVPKPPIADRKAKALPAGTAPTPPPANSKSSRRSRSPAAHRAWHAEYQRKRRAAQRLKTKAPDAPEREPAAPAAAAPAPAPRPPRPSEAAANLKKAELFLKGQLAKGPKPAGEIEAAADKARIGVDHLERAKDALGITAARLAAANGSAPVHWQLP